MSWLVPKYTLKKGWGHTVRLVDPYDGDAELGSAVDYKAIDAILEWATANSGGNRIGYDLWKFRSHNDAQSFIMLYKLTWGQ